MYAMKTIYFILALFALTSCRKEDPVVNSTPTLVVTVIGDAGSTYSFKIWKTWEPSSMDTFRAADIVYSGPLTSNKAIYNIPMNSRYYYAVGYRIEHPYQDSIYYSQSSGQGYYYFLHDHNLSFVNTHYTAGLGIPALNY